MANEFKIKKGLIVTGASGGTVVDIQGSQGQLFSVTDDLSGSIFAVSDISGVPILDVNSSGVSYFDGSLGIGTANPSRQLEVVSSGGIVAVLTSTTGGSYISMEDSSTTSDSKVRFGAIGDNAIIKSGGTTALSLDTSQNATFAGNIVMANAKILYTDDIRASTGPMAVGPTGEAALTLRTFSTTRLTIASDGDATFTEQAFSAATSSGDASSTLTTKGYVDGLITGATIYRGAWDPSGGGYGSPDLSGVTQTSGYYYICSADGTAEPNGTGTEPDTWAVGDWCIYNDVSGTGQWQKIDNSSVLSGVGTGQTVALWEGAGSVTDSETLGNAPITVSGNDTAFAGNITAYTGGGSGSLGVGRTSNQSIKLYISDTNNSITAEQDSDGNSAHKFILNRVFDGTGANDFKIQKGGTDQFTLDTSANATFAGTITGQNIYGNQFVDAQDNAYYANPAMTSIMKGASFDGDVTVTTQAVGDDSTLVATTEYADRAAANVPIGNYLPLTAGSGFPLTGRLDLTSTGGTGIRIVTGDTSEGYLIFGDAADNSMGGIAYNNNTNTFSIDCNNSERITILSDGNVGIGTTNPDFNLDINGDVRIEDSHFLRFGGSVSSTEWAIQHTGTDLNFAEVGSADARLFLKHGGNVGIGTASPDFKLDVAGEIKGTNLYAETYRSARTDGDIYIQAIAATDFVSIGTQVSPNLMRIEGGGNVGIGATNPGFKLDVNSSAFVGARIESTSSGYAPASILLESGDSNSRGQGIYQYNSVSKNSWFSGVPYSTTSDDWVIAHKLETTAFNSDVAQMSNALFCVNDNGNVGIGTTTPKAKLDINGHFCVDSKSHTVTNAFTTCLTINLSSHTGCHVIITAFGDWPNHSSAAYRGEFFVQNGADGYKEPGIILRQDDNSNDTSDQIICQIVDPTSTANPKDFQIQIRHTDPTSPVNWTAQLTYTVQGKFNSIT